MLDERDGMFTEQEIDRQDKVDGVIFSAIEELTPIGYARWDIELIGEVRDVIMEYVVNKKKWMTEKQFYPYRELEPEPEPEEFVISDRRGKLSHLFEDTVYALDAQKFADLVGEIFGGTCRFQGEYKYLFIPNSDYQGGLDDIKED
jgi:hypothetical protein